MYSFLSHLHDKHFNAHHNLPEYTPHWSRLISSPPAYPYVNTINLIMLVLDLKNSEGSLLPLEEKV